MKWTWLAAAMLGVTSVGTSAQASVAQAPALDSATSRAVDHIVAQAAANGLPTGPLRAKTLEGVSRGADGARIIAVVERYAEALGAAREAIGRAPDGHQPTESEIVAAAGAITAGVSSVAATALASAVHIRHDNMVVTVPFVIATDLVARGVPADSAVFAVRMAAARGATDASLWRLREEVAHDIAQGATPVDALMLRAGVHGPPPGPPPGISNGPTITHPLVEANALYIPNQGLPIGSLRLQSGERTVGWIGIGNSTNGTIGLGAGLWRQVAGVTVGVSASAGNVVGSITQERRGVPDSAAGNDTGNMETSSSIEHWLGMLLRANVHWESRRLALDLAGGTQSNLSSRGSMGQQGWVAATGELRVLPFLSFVVAGGNQRQVSEVTYASETPVGHYVTGGLRFTSLSIPGRRIPVGFSSEIQAIGYRLVAQAGGGYVLTIRAPRAASVEVSGDLTNWQPVACIHASTGEWTFPSLVGAGVHQVNIRVDHGAWAPPPGAPMSVSAYGNPTGIVVAS